MTSYNRFGISSINNFSLAFLQCVFFIWCMLPITNNGSAVIYHRVVRPYFLKHQNAADEAIDKLAGKAKDLVADVISKTK